MSRKINYQKQLFQVVEALLEGTPPARVRAQRIVQRCHAILTSEEKQLTLDAILWGSSFAELNDSFLYEHEQYLRDTHENLIGNNRNVKITVFRNDYHSYFTADEAKWYSQLVSLVDFLLTIPFAQFHAATEEARQNKTTWEKMYVTIPEVLQADNLEKAYKQKKLLIEEIVTRNPSPENIGDEKIYNIMLREVTSVLTGIQVGKSAVYFGYPILDVSFIEYGDSLITNPFNMTESLLWAKKILATLIGKDGLFISWNLSNLANSHTLFISLH